jgi:hypothetical protein
MMSVITHCMALPQVVMVTTMGKILYKFNTYVFIQLNVKLRSQFFTGSCKLTFVFFYIIFYT